MSDERDEQERALEQARSQAEAARRRNSQRGPVDPTRIGGYEVVARLGAGGMGIVYLAEHTQTRKVAAVKMLRPGLESESAARRFEQEIDILRRLDHPNIARIYEAGTAEHAGAARAWYAMEYVAGRHIIRHSDINALKAEKRLSMVGMVCGALAHAHERGVLHRDIKPHNILVEMPGTPKLMDFGVARLTQSDKTTMHTQIGQVLGTVQYMSPEQIRGNHDQLDARTDIYALGVVLYELLCGRLPYPHDGRDTPALLRAMREGNPTPPRQANAELSEEVERVILTAMTQDPGGRYPSAQAMGDDIARVLRGERARGVAAVEEPVKRPRGFGVSWSRLFGRGGPSDAAPG
ncbi:MAG: serine/threonine protein kinase [Phycisphaerales bacterium]|nr:serine/threonine protein kinase [Phycisphaerales bacterium]